MAAAAKTHDFAARLVFQLHAQSFALNGDRRQHKAASAASGLGKAMKIRPPQLAAFIVAADVNLSW
jgi:hypothetical protein